MLLYIVLNIPILCSKIQINPPKFQVSNNDKIALF